MPFARLISHRTLKLCPQAMNRHTLSYLFVRNSVPSVFSVVTILVRRLIGF
jgi:hypothetical protein